MLFSLAAIILPFLGLVFFVKGTINLTKNQDPHFEPNKNVYTAFLVLLFTFITYELFYLPSIVLYYDAYRFFTNFDLGSIIAFAVLIFVYVLFTESKKSIGIQFKTIIDIYTVAVIMLVVGGVIILESLEPLEHGEIAFEDLSILRQSIATLGYCTVLIPFVLTYIP